MKTKILIATVCISSLLVSCRTSKTMQQTAKANEVELYFTEKEFRTDKDFFRASQSGSSTELSTAKKIALQNAKTELAGNIQTTVKAVTDQYTNQRGIAQKQEFESKFEELARTVTNQTLNDVKIIGEKALKDKGGKYTYYVAIQTSKESVVDGISDRVSKDEKMQLDFDKFQFQKVFDEEMKKFENR